MRIAGRGPVAFLIVAGLALAACAPAASPAGQMAALPLPTPHPSGRLSLEEALQGRRSVRGYTSRALTAGDLGQLLWAAQGQNRPGGYRTAPSAGALYPLELYVADRQAVWLYRPAGHHLEPLRPGDHRAAICRAALSQGAVCHAAAVFVFAAVPERTTGKYGERGLRYIWLEAGHAAQNLLLQAVALGLGGVPIGAFHDDELLAAIGAPAGQMALYIVAVGEPAE